MLPSKHTLEDNLAHDTSPNNRGSRRFAGLDVVHERAVVRIAVDVHKCRVACELRRRNGCESEGGSDQRVTEQGVPPMFRSGYSLSGQCFVSGDDDAISRAGARPISHSSSIAQALPTGAGAKCADAEVCIFLFCAFSQCRHRPQRLCQPPDVSQCRQSRRLADRAVFFPARRPIAGPVRSRSHDPRLWCDDGGVPASREPPLGTPLAKQALAISPPGPSRGSRPPWLGWPGRRC